MLSRFGQRNQSPLNPVSAPYLDRRGSGREGRVLVAVLAVGPDTEALGVGEHVLQQLGPLGVRAGLGKLDGLVDHLLNLQNAGQKAYSEPARGFICQSLK